MKSLIIPAVIVSTLTAAAAQPVFTVPKSYPLPQASVTVGWNANPASEGITGYNLYLGDKSRAYTNWTAVAGTQLLVPVVRGSTNYIAVTAVNSLGLESPFSAELVYVAPSAPSSPANVVKVSVVVQGSTNMLQWINLATHPVGTWTNPPDPVMTFRSVLTIDKTPL